MKKLLILIGFVFAFQMARAQEVFTKSSVFVDAQTGVSNIGFRFGAGVHYGISPLFSVGANFNYQTIDPKIKYTTAWVPEISADYHFAKLTKTDWYVGTSVGYCFWESDDAIDYNSGCAYSSYDSKHRRDVIYNAHILA